MNSKFRNKGLWLSIVSLLFLILKKFGVIEDTGFWDIVTTTLASALVTAGILSNPTDGDFYDDISTQNKE